MNGPGFDREAVARAVDQHGEVVRVVLAKVRGSTPREVGASMLVWAEGFEGTVGGGALEYECLARARELLAVTGTWERRRLDFALGPSLGQCCGGAAVVVLERFAEEEVAALRGLEGGGLLRPLGPGVAPVELTAGAPVIALKEEALSEAWAPTPAPLWVYGAGHVGRAVVRAVEDLPLSVTWVDIEAARFPDALPAHAERLVAAEPVRAVGFVPAGSLHLVMTHSHALDLDLCDALLPLPVRFLGLIGSKTKRARFRSRLRQRGHPDERLDQLVCPIGDPSLGKRPAAIALGVAVQLLRVVQSG